MPTFTTFQYNTLTFMNELAQAHRQSDVESWPTNRDEVLAKHGQMGLSFLEFDPSA